MMPINMCIALLLGSQLHSLVYGQVIGILLVTSDTLGQYAPCSPVKVVVSLPAEDGRRRRPPAGPALRM